MAATAMATAVSVGEIEKKKLENQISRVELTL